MHRRSYIQTAATAGVLLLAGCASGSDDNLGTERATATTTPTPTATATPTQTPTPQREVLLKETIYSRNRYPFDLKEGQKLVISVDVKRGGPVVVDVADIEAMESLFSDRVETQDTFEVDLQSTGTHYVTFQNVSEATIEVVLVEATG